MSTQEVAAGVQAVKDQASRLGLTTILRPATVTDQWTAPNAVAVVMDGDVTIQRAISRVGQVPPGSRVVVQEVHPHGLHIVGFYGGGPTGRLPDQYLDGAVLGNTGNIVTAVSAESNLPPHALSAYLIAGMVYELQVQVVATFTVASDSWIVRARLDTALTGTLIGFGRWSPGSVVDTKYFNFPFEATTTGITNIFFSIGRTSGTGTTTVVGAPGVYPPTAAYSAIKAAGASSTYGGPWRMNVT